MRLSLLQAVLTRGSLDVTHEILGHWRVKGACFLSALSSATGIFSAISRTFRQLSLVVVPQDVGADLTRDDLRQEFLVEAVQKRTHHSQHTVRTLTL